MPPPSVTPPPPQPQDSFVNPTKVSFNRGRSREGNISPDDGEDASLLDGAALKYDYDNVRPFAGRSEAESMFWNSLSGTIMSSIRSSERNAAEKKKALSGGGAIRMSMLKLKPPSAHGDPGSTHDPGSPKSPHHTHSHPLTSPDSPHGDPHHTVSPHGDPHHDPHSLSTSSSAHDEIVHRNSDAPSEMLKKVEAQKAENSDAMLRRKSMQVHAAQAVQGIQMGLHNAKVFIDSATTHVDVLTEAKKLEEENLAKLATERRETHVSYFGGCTEP